MGPPGIFLVKSKITKDGFKPEDFTRWYNDTHVPDIIATSGISAAFRYENVDPTADRPYLVWYSVKDLDWLQTSEFNSIPDTDPMFPGDKKCYNVANFDIRAYELIQEYEGKEGKGTEPGPAAMLIFAGAHPKAGGEDDFDTWYRQEHCLEVSKTGGYRRTRRYKLAWATERPDAGTAKADQLPALALHEFDSMPSQEELMPTSETPWAKSTWGKIQKQDVGVYKLVKSFGEAEGRLW